MRSRWGKLLGRIVLGGGLLGLSSCGGEPRTASPTLQETSDATPAAVAAPTDGIAKSAQDWVSGDQLHNHAADLNAAILETPESERAWPSYREFLAPLAEPAWSESDLTPASASWPRVVQFLNQHARELDLLAANAQKPHLGFLLSDGVNAEDARAFHLPVAPSSPNPLLMSINLVAVTQLSPAVMVACAAARQHAEEGDGAGAARFVQAAIGICRQMLEFPVMIAQQESWRRLGQTLVVLQELLRDHPDLLSDQQLADIESALRDYGPPELTLGIDAGRTIMDAVQRLASPQGGVSTRLEQIATMVARAGGKVATPREEAAFLDGLLKRSRQEYSLTIDQRSGWSAYAELRAKQQSEPLYVATLLFPAVESAYYQKEVAAQQHDAARWALGAHRFRLRTGVWPESIEELSLDPPAMDRFSGLALRYRSTEATFVLYSVGPDGQDDGGSVDAFASPTALASALSENAETARTQAGDWRLWSSGK